MRGDGVSIFMASGVGRQGLALLRNGIETVDPCRRSGIRSRVRSAPRRQDRVGSRFRHLLISRCTPTVLVQLDREAPVGGDLDAEGTGPATSRAREGATNIEQVVEDSCADRRSGVAPGVWSPSPAQGLHRDLFGDQIRLVGEAARCPSQPAVQHSGPERWSGT